MNLLLSALERFMEFVALCLYVFFWCAIGGIACFFFYSLLRTIRRYIEEKHENELIDKWHQRNMLIAGAVMDLDSPDPLQRALAEQFIDSLLP